MKRGRLQLKHIEAFRAVIACGSASKAAQLLGLTQPAVSNIVGQAEAHIGIPLFDRRHGRLVPTPKALVLYEETNVLFATLENLESIVSRVTRETAQPIAFGSVPLLAMLLLPRVLPKWIEENGRALFLHTHDGANLLNLVASRQVEIALIAVMPHMVGVESRVIARSPLYCALPVGHPLAKKRVVLAADLHDQPFISLSRAEGIQAGADRAFLAANVRPREIMQIALMASAIKMAEAGAGITLVDSFGMQLADHTRLAFRPFEPVLHIDYCAVWPAGVDADFARSSLLKRFSHEARNTIESARECVARQQYS